MRSLHFHLPFGMYHRARAPSIRFRLLPTLWTDDLLVPPISMLQQQLPQHLSHQLPSQQRQLACYLIKARLRMLFPPLPHLRKHLLRPTHKFRLRLFSFHFAPPFALLSSYSKSTSFQPRKKSGMHPQPRDASQNGGELSYTSCCNQATVSFSSNLRQTNRCHSLLPPRIWAVGPSALPCAGAAPPQRPALSRHRANSSPATCLANSIPPKRPGRGRPCACPPPPPPSPSPSPQAPQ